MSKARELAELGAVYDSGALSNRNLIINGAFQCWQRGTSSTTHGYGSADRWYHYTSGTGFTFAQSTDAPDGFTYSLTTTGTPADEYNVGQGIELPAANEAGVFTNGQTITVSYYAKSSTAGDRLWNALFFRTAVQSSSGQVSIDFDNTDNNLLSTSWQRFSKTYTIGVVPANNCNQLAIQIRSRNNANSSATPAGNISIAGVQIELGTEATPFEHRSYADELTRCQRYFQPWRSYAEYDLGSTGNVGSPISNFTTPMRASPTMTVVNSAGSNSSLNSMTLFNLNSTNFFAYLMNLNVPSNGYFYASRDGTADAEL